MLKREVLQERTYKLLKDIMSKKEFGDFALFGGTALALYIGHRKSIDLDFIKQDSFETSDIRNKIREYYNFVELRHSENVLIGEIDKIKVDFVYERCNLLTPIVEDDNIRLLSMEDICAMKLMAICDNGSRVKDYVDIAMLSTYFSFNEMLSFFNKKYEIKSSIIPVRPLCDFSRLDMNQKVDMIDKSSNIAIFQDRILDMVKNPEKVYKSL